MSATAGWNGAKRAGYRVVLAVALATVPLAAMAHEADVDGQVLALLPASGEVVVRVDLPGAGSRAETVRVLPRAALRALAPGDRIAGRFDADPHPPTLDNVRVLGRAALTGTPSESAAPLPPVAAVTLVRTGDPVPNPALVDQRGRPFSLRDVAGQTVVLAFVYTRCADKRECPLISGKFAVLQQRFRGLPVHLVEVSLDPQYDRPDVLARYARTFGADPARWTLATGDPRTVLDFVARFNVTAFPDPRVGVIHTERTVLIDPHGIVRTMLDDVAWTPGDVVAEVDAQRGLASNPLERLNLWLSSAAVAVCGNAVESFSGFADLLVVCAIVALAVLLGWRVLRVLSPPA